MNNSSDCNSSLPDNVRRNVVLIFSSGGFFGVLTCSIAIAFLLFFKMYKTFSERLVLYLLLSALFLATIIAVMITGVGLDFDEHHGLCQAISFLVQYSVWLLLLFTTAIVIHLAALVFFYRNINRLEPVIVIFSVTFPLLFSWIPFVHDTYGLSGAWCWIRVYHHSECTYYKAGLIEQYALWYAPFSLTLLVNSIVTIAISAVLCNRARRPTIYYGHGMPLDAVANEYRNVLRNSLPLLAYPIIYNITSWFTLANRIRRSIFPGGSYVSWIIHAIAAPTWTSLAGIAFIIYVIVLKKLTRHGIRKAAHSWGQTFARLCNRPMPVYDPIDETPDHLTNDGFTVTSPTMFEVPQESEFDNNVL